MLVPKCVPKRHRKRERSAIVKLQPVLSRSQRRKTHCIGCDATEHDAPGHDGTRRNMPIKLHHHKDAPLYAEAPAFPSDFLIDIS